MKNCEPHTKMNHKVIIFLLLLFFTCSQEAESNAIDSLKLALDFASDNLEKIEILNELSSTYRQISTEKSLQYGMQALELARQEKDSQLQAKAIANVALTYYYRNDFASALTHFLDALNICNTMGCPDSFFVAQLFNNTGMIYNNLGQYENALEYYKKALEIKQAAEREISSAYTLNNIGIVYTNMLNYEEAIESHNQALTIGKNLKNNTIIVAALNNLGNVYRRAGAYDKALDRYFQVKEITEEQSDSTNMTIVLNNIGNIFKDIHDYELALTYYTDALEIANKVGKSTYASGILNNIANVYERLGNYDKALEYYNSAIEQKQKMGDYKAIAGILNNIGIIYQDLNSNTEALHNYFQALEISQKYRDKKIEALCYKNIGSIYQILGMPKEANTYILQALTIAKEIQDLQVLQECYRILSELYAAEGDYPLAYDYYTQYNSIKDSIFSQEMTREIMQLQRRQEIMQKEDQISLLAKENEIKELTLSRQRIFLWAFGITVIALIILFAVLHYNYRLKKRMSKILEEKVEERTKELAKINKQLMAEIHERERLESQIRIAERLAATGELAAGIAHEIRNPLSVIHSTVQYCSSKYQDDEEMAQLLQMILQETERANNTITSLLKLSQPDISLKQGNLLEVIQDTGALIKSECKKNNTNLSMQLPPYLPPVLLDKNQLKSVFLNILLNSLDAMPNGGELLIKMYQDAGKIIVQISDTGIGIKKEDIDKVFKPFFTTKPGGTGLGLSLAYQIIKSHNGEMEISSTPDQGTTVTLRFPVFYSKREE